MLSTPALTALGAATLVAAALILGEILHVRLRWIARRRRGDRYDAFERVFLARGIPAELVRASYGAVQERSGVRGFPVRPGDDLAQVYGLDRSNAEDLLCVAAMRARCSEAVGMIFWRLGPLTTVEDLVCALAPVYAASHGETGRARLVESA
jgi:hypothetical protein